MRTTSDPCRDLRRRPQGKALTQLVHRRAWQLAALAYRRYTERLAEQVRAGAVSIEQIESWEPAER